MKRLIRSQFALLIAGGMLAVASVGVAANANGHADTPASYAAANAVATVTMSASGTPGATPPNTASPPAAPTNLYVNVGTRAVTWTDNSRDEDGFRVTVAVDDAAPVSYSLPAGTTAFTIPPAQVQVIRDGYVVTVVAFNASGDSAPVSIAREAGAPVPPTPAAPPAAPSSLQVNLGTGQVTWTDNSRDENGFRVTVAVDNDAAVSYSLPEGSTAFTIPPAQVQVIRNGVTVTVVAFNAAGDSAPVGISRATGTQPAPTTPGPSVRLPATGTGSAPSATPGAAILVSVLLAASAASFAAAALRTRRSR